LVAGAVVTLLGAGCSDDDSSSGADSTEQADGGGSDEAGTDEPAGDGDGSSDGGDSSGGTTDIGIPLPPGAEAVATTEAGALTVVQFIVPLEQQAATIAFYDDWTASQPDEYTRIEVDSGGVSWQNAPEPGADGTIIAVLSPLEGDDFVAVTVTNGPLE
jgi:hypothetical protein